MEEKKMILVTDGYDDKPICVASNTIAARKSALDYLENQYDDGEWEAILEEDGYENRDDLFHDMMLGMESEWERFNINFAEVSFAGEYMTTFTMIILIAFVLCLVWQFVAAIERDCIGLEIMFAAEILMFAYLAKTLM